MSNKKVSIIITIAVIVVIVGMPIIFSKHKNPTQQPTVVTGLTEGQQKTFQQDLSGAMKQFGYIKKGDKLLAEGKFDDAIREYQTALSLAKSAGTKGEALRSLADLYEKKKDYKKVLEYITIETDKYIADWAKSPLLERSEYLKYASEGEYEHAV